MTMQSTHVAMRAFALTGAELQLALADVGPELEPAVRKLGFDRRGALFVRSFPAAAPYAAEAVSRFEAVAEPMVRQAAGLEPVPWSDALTTLVERAGTDGWWLAGSVALAVRGIAVGPRDLDVISDTDGCERLAGALADLLIEPLADGGHLGERWLRAFAGARVECVGGVHVDHAGTDFGAVAATRLETVEWNGHRLRVPPLELQLRAAERRGLDARAALIREALA
jgi:hypothetical protein